MSYIATESIPTTHSGLNQPLAYRKDVTKQFATALRKLGLVTAKDVLWHIPRRWEDRSQLISIDQAMVGETVTLKGKILSVSSTRPNPKLSIVRALLDGGAGAIVLIWFNQPYLEKTFRAFSTSRTEIIVYGQIKQNGMVREMQNPEWEAVYEDNETARRPIVPVYPIGLGVSQYRLRKLVDSILYENMEGYIDPIPLDIRERHHLMDARKAFYAVHFPSNELERQDGLRRLAFEEFFLLQVMLAQRRRQNQSFSTLKMDVNFETLKTDLHSIVPFTLTDAQLRAVAEIAGDVQSGRVMNRLVQGDVGSGKTMVAVAAILMAVQNGCQAALMAPTEILAQQHAIVLRRLLEPLGIPVELSIGSLTEKQKHRAHQNLLTGQARVAVGTHALIQEGVAFAKLGLVIVDEQHRFGVLQRQALTMKGSAPHVLVMTATPIPRTLTMTLYGDLDTTILDELPPGRKPITTHWRTPDRRNQVYTTVQRILSQGRQVYVVCPLVEESEKLQVKSAVQMHQHISEEVFPSYRVGLLHGQMKPEDKEAVMASFKAHELDVLVATTVIEVGIDVPNSSVIIIEDADRFGLSQLHQLRGRVGRGQHASYCILVADPKTTEGQARMQIMTETTDGFKIAEEDLKLRGPGDLYGTKQSGMPDLHVADLVRDVELMALTRQSAQELIDRDPDLEAVEHAALRSTLLHANRGLELAVVG